jgi:hypothetical protein
MRKARLRATKQERNSLLVRVALDSATVCGGSSVAWQRAARCAAGRAGTQSNSLATVTPSLVIIRRRRGAQSVISLDRVHDVRSVKTTYRSSVIAAALFLISAAYA